MKSIVVLFLVLIVTTAIEGRRRKQSSSTTTALPLIYQNSNQELDQQKQDIELLKQQVRTIHSSLSKLSADLESNVIRMRTESSINSRKLKGMIDDLRNKVNNRMTNKNEKDEVTTQSNCNNI